MFKKITTLSLGIILVVLLVSFISFGCTKKQNVVTTPLPDPASSAVGSPSTDVKQSLADVDAALKAKAYVKAVQTMLAIRQQAQLTDQEAQEAHNRMVEIQSSLASSIANGDPNAKAAAEILRQSVLR